MPLYLVDRDLPRISSEALDALHQAATMACQETTSAGQAVHYLHSTFIPGEQRCLCLFEGDDEALVAAVNEAAGLPFTRIVTALAFTPEGVGAQNINTKEMTMTRRPFRFGFAMGSAPSREAWAESARKVEALGYSTLVTGDHIAFGPLAPMLALMAAADATTTLRLGTHVLANDFRNPAMLAHEAATLDLLSGGRLEFGIGAGWFRGDYTAAGIPFEAPATRVKRLKEVVTLFKRLFGDEPVTFHGEHYHVEELSLQPKPLQRPHPPLYIGGAGKRMLSLAGREANIVGLGHTSRREGGLDYTKATAVGVEQQVAWIREAAGSRFEEIEFHMLLNNTVVTNNRRKGAEEIARWIAGFPPEIVVNAAQSVEEVLVAPYLLVGSVEQLVEDLQERRERFGVSYITISGDCLEAFSPVVARLAGT